MKKSNNVDHENLVDILKGSISYDISKVITDQLTFIKRIQEDTGKSTSNKPTKEADAYLTLQRNKLDIMMNFINEAVSDATGEYYGGTITSNEKVLRDFNIKLVMTKKEES
tara:strand:+ start:2707 stop:3039 length:333 start_codon:yes stop_codon:yes gene_type:complete